MRLRQKTPMGGMNINRICRPSLKTASWSDLQEEAKVFFVFLYPQSPCFVCCALI